MKFEHLIQVNDTCNPDLAPLSRAALWRGLVLRAESPGLFMPQLDACRLSAQAADSLWRELRYGELIIRDQVRYEPGQCVHYQVPAQGGMAASSMSMRIEEPEPGVLFVRFEYDDGGSEEVSREQAFYDQFRRAAYEQADLDTMRIIRELSGPD